MLCTLVLNGLVRSAARARRSTPASDFEVVTVSFDPSETPELAAREEGSDYLEAPTARRGAATAGTS